MTLEQLQKALELLGAYLGEDESRNDYGRVIKMPNPSIKGFIVLRCENGEEFHNVFSITCYDINHLIKISFRENEHDLSAACIAPERVSSVIINVPV